MSKFLMMLRASWLQLRIYFIVIFALVLASIMANVVVWFFVAPEENSMVSPMNTLTVFLLFAGSVLPAALFKKLINLGASRHEYYQGLILTLAVYAFVFALLNTVWFPIEAQFLGSLATHINIIEVFGWDQFGFIGMFLYQFGAYMMLLSLLALLFSGLKHVLGWIIWVVLIAAIPIGTSVSSFRPKVAEGFLTLLFNDSLWQGLGLTLLFSLVFLMGVWLFTRKRTV